MNLFSFTANFESEESCRLHYKEEHDKQVLYLNMVQKNIFGSRVTGVMNAKHVRVEPPYKVV